MNAPTQAVMQDAEQPATPLDVVRAFSDYLNVHEVSGRMDRRAMGDMALDLARIALDFKHLVGTKAAAPPADFSRLPLAESEPNSHECQRWLAVINPLLKYAGSPGDWGYGSRLGLLTKHLYQVRADLEKKLEEEAK